MTLDEILAAGRHVVTFAGGLAAALGIASIGTASIPDVQGSFDHVLNGIKEIGVGLGPLAAIAMAWWAQHRSTVTAKITDVAAMPSVKAVIVKPNATPEVIAVARDSSQPKVSSS